MSASLSSMLQTVKSPGRLLLSSLLLSVLFAAPALKAAFPATAADSTLGGDDRWGTEFPPPGVTFSNGDAGSISGVMVWRGHPVITGYFDSVEGVPASGVALWDEERWWDLGEGLGSSVSLSVVGDRLFALRSVSGTSEADRSPILEWHDGAWIPFGLELFGGTWTDALSMTEFDGELVVSGRRTTRNEDDHLERHGYVDHFTATGWQALGDSVFCGTDDVVRVRTVGGELIAYGSFVIAGDDTARNIARWTGSAWEPIGEGFDGPVTGMAFSQGRMVAVGRFESSGKGSTPGAAFWWGGRWQALGGGLRFGDGPGRVISLSQSGDSLFVVGWFDRAGQDSTDGVALWTGDAWRGLPGSSDPDWRLYDGRSAVLKGKWLVTGTWYGLSGSHYTGLFAWEDGGWVPFTVRGVELVSRPSALFGDESGLLAAGKFLAPTEPGPVPAIGVWDGREWNLLAGVHGTVLAFARYGSRLMVAGDFDGVGGYRVNNIAMLHQDGWASMGGGTDGPVYALQSHDGELFAGGDFTRAGGANAMNIARWNGAEWRPVGSGANAVTFQIDDLDSYGGNLYACGYFRWLGQDHITAIARWDGTAWSGLGEDGPLAGGRDRYYEAPYCHEMALWRGRLAVVGRFDSAGGTSSRDLAQWDGFRWEPVAPPVQRADEILGFGPYLLVGGTAFPLGEDFFGKPYLRAWDGDRWLDLGHGVWSGSPNIHTAPEVTAMAVWNGDLYVAGRFRAAGDHPARYLAVWHGDVQARPVFRNRLLAGPNPATGPVTVSVDLEEPGPGALRVLDVQGREVARLADGYLPGGERSWTWNLRDDAGRRVVPGVYFLRLDSSGGTVSARLVVLP